jgi:xanthine dehydrogenase molybdenum-binding subunit
MRAAEDARAQLVDAAARIMKVPPEELEMAGGRVRHRQDARLSLGFGEISLAEHMTGSGPIIGNHAYLPAMKPVEGGRCFGMSFPAFGGTTIGVHVAVADIDRETGAVRVHRVVAVHDVGKAINPMAAEGQIEGGIALGLGFGLTEEMKFDATGSMMNDGFADYKLQYSTDMPEMVPVLLETPSSETPFGAKGLGEPTMAPTAAAVRNAVLDASGIGLSETPMSPERNYRAFQGGGA